MYDKYGLKSVFLHMFCAFIKHKEDMGYRSSIRIVYVFRELEAWRKRSIPTHSNGSIHSLLSPKIGLRSA